MLTGTVAAGSVIKLQKDGANPGNIAIDFINTEQVAPIGNPDPATYVVPNGTDQQAVQAALDAARRRRQLGLCRAHPGIAAEAENHSRALAQRGRPGGQGGRECGVTACHQRRCPALSPSNRPDQGCGGTSMGSASSSGPSGWASGRRTSSSASSSARSR